MISTCENEITKSDEVNFLQKLNFENEKRKIAHRITDNKGSIIVTSQSKTIQTTGIQRQTKTKLTAKLSENKSQKMKFDDFKKVKNSPFITKLQTIHSVQRQLQYESEKNLSPKQIAKIHPKLLRSGNGLDIREKSECSKSNFHLSVLKSEKISNEIITKKSCFGNGSESNLILNNQKNSNSIFGNYSRLGKNEHLEDQVKLTVFKTSQNSNVNGLNLKRY